MKTLLTATDVSSGYGKLQVLSDVSLTVQAGEIVAVVGANGAGKTTLLRTLNGILHATSGNIHFNGHDITRTRTERMAALGLSHVPENRLCFPDLSVEDNLLLGAWSRGNRKDISPVLELFPRIKNRLKQPAGTLSGGEQQMVAIGRALMSRPDLILLDEPSTGLAPLVVTEIMDSLQKLASHGTGILLVEQNVKASFRIADSAVLLHRGTVVKEGTPSELIEDPEVKAAYLGHSE